MSEDTPPRPKIHDIVTAEELKGMATDAGMSEEMMGKMLGPLLGLPGAGGEAAVSALESIGKSLGFKTEKTARLDLACAYPAAVRALVFALSSQRYGLTTAFDTPHGAYFEAMLPRNIWSSPGTLQFDLVEQGPDAVQLTGASEIDQVYDWGKGKRALNGVMEKVEEFARRLG
jgi:hypothetical protein